MVPHTSQETTWSATELSIGRKPWAARVVLLLSSVCMTALALVGMAVTATPAATGLVSFPQSVAPQVATAKLVGATTGSQAISLAITLHSRNQKGMQDYATQVAQPKSKLYHQYLTPAQFASAFGADPAALNNVEKYMQQQGLHLSAAQSGGLFLTFSGTVSQVESAFHTQINNYKAVDGRAVYANATALQVPAALAATITDVAGTETIRATHAAGVVSTKQPTVTAHVTVTCPTVTATNFTGGAAPYTFAGVLPTQLAKAYSMTSTTPGAGVWVALIEGDGFATADLAQYETCVNPAMVGAVSAASGNQYSSSSLIQTRFPGLGSAITPGASAQAVEAEMETLLGLTPNLTHLTVVEAAPTAMGTQLALADIANSNGPQVVGDQWGMCESDLGFPNAQAEEQLFMQMALQGQSAFAATGNNGLYACNGDGKNFQNNGFGVMDPASDPFVTAVGGTQLGVGGNTATTTTWSAEQPWSNANLTTTGTYAAGGGGISQFWSAMPWQTAAKAALNAAPTGALSGVLSTYNNGTTSARVVPDVAAAADPTNSSVAIYCSVGSCASGITTFSNVGGTNIANAIWVATAVEASQAALPTAPTTGGRIGLAAPALYTAYGNDTATVGVGVTLVGATKYCDYVNQLGGSTTSSTAVGTGLNTVLMADTTGLFNGMAVTITGGPGGPESGLTISNVAAGSFQVTVANAHNTGAAVTYAVSTTTGGAIVAGAGVVVTPPSMNGIYTGQSLLIDTLGSGVQETVTVTATTTTTFTATFANSHGAGVPVTGTFSKVTTTALGEIGSVAFTVASIGAIGAGTVLHVVGPGTEDVTVVGAPVGNVVKATFGQVHAASFIVDYGTEGAGAAAFGAVCLNPGYNVLNDTLPLGNASVTAITSVFPAAVGFQQLAATTTAVYGSAAGFGVKGNFTGPAYTTGYNALTGLGSPVVGNTTGGTNLAAYMAAQNRVAIPHMYMVAQSTNPYGPIPVGTYWLGSYGLNPYVQNLPTNTQWSPLNTSQVFTGAPAVIDDANVGAPAGSPANIYIIGPTTTSSTSVAILDYNIATATTTVVTQNGIPASPVPAGTTGCKNVAAAASSAGDAFTIYCVASNNGLYAENFTIAGTTFGGVAWSGPLLSNVAGQPAIAEQGFQSTSYMVIAQQTGSGNVFYSGALTYSGLKTALTMSTLATTCVSTPAVVWAPQISSYAASCIATDTKNMWANVFSPTKSSWAMWQTLGQPSPGVTLLPGGAVTVDNLVNDPGYGLVFYIAEGSDKGMYLDVANPTGTNFLGTISGWQSVSYPGVFSSYAGADFASGTIIPLA